MVASKIAISIDTGLLKELDLLVANHVFPSRSRAFQEALRETIGRIKHERLARESAKLDTEEEQALAEEEMGDTWPEY